MLGNIATFRDRSHWARGPWDDEPDRIEWRDEKTGMPCLMVRNLMGTWCGYAAVPPGHPLHGTNYDEVEGISVHGGLTFSGECQEDKEHGICHRPEPGEPDNVHWFGFDTAHCYDLVPASLYLHQTELYRDAIPGIASLHAEEVYRDAEYVRGEVTSLARQLAGIRR